MQYRLSPRPGLRRVNKNFKTSGKQAVVAKPRVQRRKQNQTIINEKNKKRIAQSNRIRRRSVNAQHVVSVAGARNRKAVVEPRNHGRARTRKRGRRLSPSLDKINNIRNSGVGRILVIVANGPSVSESQLPQLVNHPKIDLLSINTPDVRIWPTKYWVFCDQSQYRRHEELWRQYTGTVFNSGSIKASHPGQIVIRHRGGKGFSRDLADGFFIGRSTTYASMQIALWMGYDKIFIFGCDMCRVGSRLHFYGKNPDVSDDNRLKRFDKEAEYYTHAAKILNADERSRFVFCSGYNEWPFVDKFGRLDHKEAVSHILQHEIIS